MIQPIGFFSIYRELFSKPIWLKSSNEQRVILITLIAMANFKPKQWEWNGEKFTVERGQFVTSAQSIIMNCNGTVTRQNVRSALKRFEKLDFLTIKSTKTGMLITIHNWDLYQVEKVKGNQEGNQEVTNTQPTGNQEVTTREEGNKVNKEIINTTSSEKTSDKPKFKFALDYDSFQYRCSIYLIKLMQKNNPNVKVPGTDSQIESWCMEFDRMNRLDKRSWEDIKKVIEFSQKDAFWSSNILSASKLRKQYDQLYMKMKSNGGGGYKPQTVTERITESMQNGALKEFLEGD